MSTIHGPCRQCGRPRVSDDNAACVAGCNDPDAYTPDNTDPDALTELVLAGPGWALFDLEVDDEGHRVGSIQADQESGIFNETRCDYEIGGAEPPRNVTITRDDRAHWQVAYDYARMRAMLERCKATLDFVDARLATQARATYGKATHVGHALKAVRALDGDLVRLIALVTP